jgi:hypothetical protein
VERWNEAVLHEISVRSFRDTDGYGIGDLAGVLEKLGYVAELGVDAVWLTPTHPSTLSADSPAVAVGDRTGAWRSRRGKAASCPRPRSARRGIRPNRERSRRGRHRPARRSYL